MKQRLMIGISACFLHADPNRPIFTGKTLQYLEQSIAHWVMSTGALALMIPNPAAATHADAVVIGDFAERLDGLVLEGGSDLWPGSYGEVPLDEKWSGDRIRDGYETRLLRAFEACGKPVLGICRGLQLINVAFGGTLYQDLDTQRPGPLRHRDPVLYDRNFHEIELVAGTRLAEIHAGVARARVNSVHHQAIKDLGDGLVVEARSPADGLIEAIRRPGASFIAAVQWHPEFHRRDEATLDDLPMLADFLGAAAASRSQAALPTDRYPATAA